MRFHAPCSERTKLVLLAALVACFVVQAVLVYSDGQVGERLGPLAVEGRRVWHERNCQACHQLHGFGGFLGPDLTNASARLAPGRLTSLLTIGSAQMPAFDLPAGDIAGVQAFLEAMNATGQGQALRPLREDEASDPMARFQQVVDARVATRQAPAAVARGLTLTREHACWACHAAPGTGLRIGPDLSTVVVRLTAAELELVLTEGRLERGMPPPGLTAAERADVTALLAWLGDAAPELARDAARAGAPPPLSLRDLPWWEYPRP